jgi:hypothetical protein
MADNVSPPMGYRFLAVFLTLKESFPTHYLISNFVYPILSIHAFSRICIADRDRQPHNWLKPTKPFQMNRTENAQQQGLVEWRGKRNNKEDRSSQTNRALWEEICYTSFQSSCRQHNNGTPWEDSHYLPFLVIFYYFLRIRWHLWINIPSERYLVFPALP